MSLNTAILMGRLTTDPELKYTQSDIPVTSFTIAVDRAYKSGEEKQTDFINIVAWRQRAEFVSRWFRKGQLIVIEGSIQTRKYTDKDGYNRTAFEVVANGVHFAGSKEESNTENNTDSNANANIDVDPENDPLNEFKNNLPDFDESIIANQEDLPF